jgi:uncharacterized protein (DUF952 family)
MPAVCFRLVTADEWTAAQASGLYAGSALDLRDGYIHMSPASEVHGTANRYFKGQTGVVVLVVDTHRLMSISTNLELKLEFVPSRSAHFPHLYGGPLPIAAVKKAIVLLDAGLGDGTFVMPPEVTESL